MVKRRAPRTPVYKGKSPNVMEYMKNSDKLRVILSYLLEEQHTVLETWEREFQVSSHQHPG